MSTGDLVRVELEPDVFQAVQEGHGGWSDVMLEVQCTHAHAHMHPTHATHAVYNFTYTCTISPVYQLT